MIRSGDQPWVRIEDDSAIGAARRAATTMAEACGFGEHDRGRVAVAVSEAASNLVKHAVEGMMLIRAHPESATAVEVIALDKGPGIRDVRSAVRDGYSTAGTLGVGLGGITRMASAHEVYSLPGRGTVVTMCFTAAGAPAPVSRVSGLTRPIGEEIVSGDAFAYVEGGDTAIGLLCDGLGHGPAAAAASREAVRVFEHQHDLPVLELLERVHKALTGTRGGAVAIARLDRARGTVRYAGLGNVSGWIVHAEGRQGMISVPGIAGHQRSRLREYEYTVPPHSVLVMHSDGLSDRWDPVSFPGLAARSPAVVAATLLRDAGTRRDDAAVLAVGTAP
ncbi:Serine/threonine-protein kinase RsbT [Nonomuraea coxensis DSM 45129]|uniref:Serine/threonine-protein kinase RsbT n=1 Tax=Nonomuraea coxensis DSM 45129 TaxID=1122611 RepID=A0ABX8U528_9ACTN|nr:SpoIIE family protein phosphatase [Nonomuraea coxensis]QYC42785.1 Serine/threonine-protein kinase RsbT [Nonomuraea coxensis DSM 45129]